MMTPQKTKCLLIVFILLLCLVFNGCATLHQGGNLLAAGIAGILKIPFFIIHKIVDFANKLPKPPPGVFGI